jgi:hypothetical protein
MESPSSRLARENDSAQSRFGMPLNWWSVFFNALNVNALNRLDLNVRSVVTAEHKNDR